MDQEDVSVQNTYLCNSAETAKNAFVQGIGVHVEERHESAPD